MGAKTECHWPLTFEFLFFQQHWILLLEDICTHILSVYRYIHTHNANAFATSGVSELQNRASAFIGLLTFPAPENAFTHLCDAKESSQRWEHVFPQLSTPTALHVPLQLPHEPSLLNVWPASCSHKTHYLLWTIISAKSRKYYRTRKRKMRVGRITKIRWVC